MPDLILYSDYSRQDVHDIFSPDTRFTQSSGTWGLQGIVEIPNKPGDFVFFVTFGQHQGDHTFDEWITEDGVISWQSQPSQSIENRKIQQFINHDEEKNSIHLFLRTQKTSTYTYFGKLKYINHDPIREKPVYLFWQLLEWPIPIEVLGRIDIQLKPSIYYSQAIKIGNELGNGNNSFVWKEKTWQIDHGELISKIRDWIVRGLPEEAIRYRDWYIEVDGKWISPKWIFHLITDANYDEFDAPQARLKLSELGFIAIQINQPKGISRNMEGFMSKNPFRLKPNERDESFQKIKEFISEENPVFFHQAIFRFPNHENWFEVHFSNLIGFYTLRLARQFDEFAYYFSAGSEKVDMIIQRISPHQLELAERFGFPLMIDQQYTKIWGRLGVEIPIIEIPRIRFSHNLGVRGFGQLQNWVDHTGIDQNQFWEKHDENIREALYALLLSDLIQATHDILGSFFQNDRKTKKNSSNISMQPQLQFLNEKILAIHHVLDGSTAIPSDEVICDWVHFCYEFGLFQEGQKLFSYITIDQVNSLYYERTKRIARLCSMRTVTKD